jgi:peroxiredoxin
MKRVIGIIVGALWVMWMQAALPSVALKDVDGKTVKTESLAEQGKPVIIAFFATWCKPCMRELEAINELYADWQEQTGVEMYIVSIDQGQDVKKVKPLVDGYGWDYHVLLDPNGELKRAMNVQNVPHLFVIDSKGQTVYNHTGYTDGSEKEIKQYLK